MNLSSVNTLLPATARGKGRLAALCGGLLISFDSVFVRLSGTGGVDTAFLFGLFSALSMAVLIQVTDRRGVAGALRQGGWPLLLSGLLLMASAASFVLSIKLTTVANTLFIMTARPVLTALAAWVLLRDKTPRSLWLTIAAVMVGILVVVNGSLGGGHLAGDGFALLAVTCLGVNGALWQRYRDMSRMAVVGLGSFFIALVMFVPASPAAYSPKTWLTMACMGLLSAPLGRVLNAVSSRYIPAAEMATIALVSGVLAPVWAFLFFAERPPLATMAGGATIFTAILTYLAVGTGPANRTARAGAQD